MIPKEKKVKRKRKKLDTTKYNNVENIIINLS